MRCPSARPIQSTGGGSRTIRFAVGRSCLHRLCTACRRNRCTTVGWVTILRTEDGEPNSTDIRSNYVGRGLVVTASQSIVPLDNFARARMFLDATYPELSSTAGLGFGILSNYPVRSDAPIHSLRSFQLEYREANPNSHDDEPRVFGARFELAADDSFESVMIGASAFNHAEAQDKFEATLDTDAVANPEAFSAALQAAQARFGPTASAAARRHASLTIERLQPVLGASRLSAVEWIIVDRNAFWDVRFTSRYRTRTLVYSSLFEPVAGKLVSLTRVRDPRPGER